MKKYHPLSPLLTFKHKQQNQNQTSLHCTYYQYTNSNSTDSHVILQCMNGHQTTVACLLTNRH